MSKDKNYSAPLTELSAEMMQAYLSNTLSNSDRHAVERYLLDHPFEAEAMQGYEHQSVDMEQDLKILSLRIEAIVDRKDRKVIPLWKRPIAIAAAITVLLVGSFAIFELLDVAQQNGQIVMNEPVEKPVEVKEQAEPVKIKADEPIEVAEEVERNTEPRPTPTQSARSSSLKNVVVQAPQKEVIEETEEITELDMDYIADYVVAEKDEIEEDLVLDEEPATLLRESYASGSIPTSMPSAKMKKSASALERKRMINDKKVKGRVLDSEEEPIAGATIIVKKTGEAAITDINGEYEIPVHSEDDVLSVSFIGFTSQDIVVGQQDSIETTMSLDLASLEEVVVVGYGAAKQDVSYSSAEPYGGYRAFRKYLEDDLVYPRWAKEQGIEGKVTVRFRVKTNGELADFEILEGLGYGCDEEAIRLIEEGPDWTPARDNGSPKETEVKVKVKFDL